MQLKFESTNKFNKELNKLSPKLKKQFFKNLRLFLFNKNHPSLNFEKISNPFYSIRINKNFRTIFYFKKSNIVCFSYIANHDVYKKIKTL